MDALTLYRVGRWCQRHHIPLIPTVAKGLGLVLFSAVVPPECEIGRNTVLGYRGLGTVIHARAKVGEGCLIGPGVTIGGRSGLVDVPQIADRVFVGAGARILGPISIGHGAVIGANAVVVHDVPARCVAVGIPARVSRTDVDVDDFATMPKAKSR